ncbi:tyrosine-type recombinase/integrase [Planctomycetes bacterium TBK1r]|uniref:Tyrosine recombinase XerC n=1 Tax=Stieleria magnilauensis TaxID=2527963 RepID=A0ABX5XYQ6_9BACT|nr:Tyrosine recombinase XerC [Planctomycetes bacterium TBK1r]
MADRPTNKGKKLPPEPLTKDETKRLLDACSRRSASGRRDRALCVVLWRAQLRLSEALRLKPSDYDAEKGFLRVLVGKGQKYRVAVIDRTAAAELDRWLDYRKTLGISGRKPIFCGISKNALGKELATAQIRAKMKRLAKKAGIEKRVHAHGLRHTGASELVDEGVPLTDIQAQLGHSSPVITNRYLHRINPEARAERMRNREW